MNNLPKCRAWDKTYKEWVNYEFCLRFDSNGECEILNAFAQSFPTQKLVLSFWTGLTDKNDRDIYEGDILKIENATAKVVFWERPPEYGLDYGHNEDEWCEDWNLTDDGDRMEIIGNIWEDADLLKQEVSNG
jgi:uncharacterized phage protein (TIGR01671 family)